MELPLADLVPGDVVLLSAGDMIPADCRILTAKDLFVAQAALTGESLPVEKSATQRVETANCWNWRTWPTWAPTWSAARAPP